MNNNSELYTQCKNGIERIENETFYFFGVFNKCFKIDDMVLEALEDPSDGYRSYFGTLCHYKGAVKHKFFDRPLAKVILEKLDKRPTEYSNSKNFRGWQLRDLTTGHSWLQFGTDDFKEYYPFFVFDYIPDKNQKTFVTIKNDYVPFKQRNPELLIKYLDWFGGDRVEF